MSGPPAAHANLPGGRVYASGVSIPVGGGGPGT